MSKKLIIEDNIGDFAPPIASPTFTGTVTTPAIIVSSETASTIASFGRFQKMLKVYQLQHIQVWQSWHTLKVLQVQYRRK